MLTNTFKFWSYLIFLIPSIFCSFFAIYHLLSNRTLRLSLNNHVIIVLLIIGLLPQVTDYPWLLYYYSHGGTWERSLIFCQIWGFIDWGIYVTQIILFAWATIERHILIFHDRWVSTKKKRLFVHYLPLFLLLLYCLILYTVVYLFPPCQNVVDYFYVTCVSACLFDDYVFSMFDVVAHETIPICLVIIFSITLLLRVLWQKYRIGQPIQWRKQRKMTIQLLAISLLYAIFFLPFAIVDVMLYWGYPVEELVDIREYALFLSYFTTPFYPYICIASIPNLRTKFTNMLLFRGQARRVTPAAVIVRAAVIIRGDIQ